MWDNRALMHRVRREGSTQVRDMRRTTVAGTALTVAQVDGPQGAEARTAQAQTAE